MKKLFSLILLMWALGPLSAQIVVPNKVYHTGPQACAFTPTTTAFAATSPNTVAAPQLVVAAAGNPINIVTTNTTAGTIEVTCDITVPGSQINGPNKGILVNAVSFLYGLTTTAMSSIAAATVNSITYPVSTAAGAAAAGTVVTTAGGTLTVTPSSLQLTTTTIGRCFNEQVTLGTPYLQNESLAPKQYSFDQVFTTAGSAATALYVCDVIVYYTETLT